MDVEFFNQAGLSDRAVDTKIKSILMAEPYPIRKQKMFDASISGGDASQYVFSLTHAPSDANKIYLAGDTFQVYASNDGGDTFEWSGDGINSNGVVSVVVDPKNKNIALAAAYHGTSKATALNYSNRGQGIYKTINGGKSWFKIKNIDFFRQTSTCPKFAFVPKSSDPTDSTTTIYCAAHLDAAAGRNEGLYKTEDFGNTWAAMSAFTGIACDGVWWDKKTDSVYVLSLATSPYLFKWDGTTKTSLNSSTRLITNIDVGYNNKDIIVATCSNSDRIVKSTDSGGIFDTFIKTGLSGDGFYEIKISPVDDNYMYTKRNAVGEKPYYTHNGGTLWQVAKKMDETDIYDPPLNPYWSMPFAVHPTDRNHALFVSDYAVVKTIDGGVNYRYAGTGFNGACARAFYFYPNGAKLIGYNDFGSYFVTKEGVFSQKGPSAGTVISIDVLGDSIGIINLEPGGTVYKFYYSKDNGGTFENVTLNAAGVYRIVKFLSSDKVVIGTTVCDDFLATTPTFTHQAFTYFPMCHDGTQFWGYASGATITLYASITGKTGSWATNYITAALSVITSDVGAGGLKIDNSNPSTPKAYVVSNYGFYRSNGSAAWDNYTSTNNIGLEIDSYGQTGSRQIDINSNDPKVIAVGKYQLSGSSNGVFVSKNKGATFRQADIDGVNNLKIEGLAYNKYDGYFYAGTYRGTFRIRP